MKYKKSYKKRPGTAGVRGQLFESKLLSLLNIRAQHDEDIKEFYLATNVDLIGEFDDICIRVKVKGVAKQMAVFIQTKHRETDKVLSLSIKNDLTGCFRSYLKIRRAFGTKNKDLQTALFGETYSDTECLFVMYTNAKYDFNNDLVETDYTTKLKELIGIEENCSYLQPTYKPEDVVVLSEVLLEEEIVTLAEHFAKLNKKVVLIDELVSCYHYILAQKVFVIPDIVNDKGLRTASFRNDFFETNEQFVLIFKNTLYEQAAREELEKWEFMVPRSFGNMDLTIRNGKEEGRLDLLSSTIVGLINDAKPNTIITIDEFLKPASLLHVNGGLAGLVGNVFVPDENSKLLKFADNIESIKGDLAKRLYLKLEKEIDNLREYKIDVKVKKFPKLSFHSREQDENLVKDFLRQLIFFTNQSKQEDIDKLAETEIRKYYCKPLNKAQVDAVFLKYHKTIQDWWMALHSDADYLTKHSKHFENATKDIMNQSLIYAINMKHTLNIQNIKYTFNATAVRSFKFLKDEQCKTNVNVIVTDNCKLTVDKLTHYLNDEKHVVLDLKYISNLKLKDRIILLTELAENEETVIFVNYGNWSERFNDIVKAVEARLFIVTKAKPNDSYAHDFANNLVDLSDESHQTFIENVNVIFQGKEVGFAHDFANNLVDLSDESQQTFLKNTNLIFQGEEVSLGLFVKHEKARKLIKGVIFHKMLEENIIFKIGMPLGNQIYDEFKDLYIDRRVSRTRKTEEDAFHEVKDKLIQTLYDLQDHVILVTAMPGMGKSTLLTHLSIKTKELYPNTWIIRINLLEYSKIFMNWQRDKTVIDSMLSLYFMCHVALGVTEEDIAVELQAENNIVSLKYCSGDASITFGYEMFLQFYNSGSLIFLFDGFDEIFPHYAKEALSLVKTVRSYPRQHKIWITSRSYNHIKDVLEQEFGRSYELEGFSGVEQKTYLAKYCITRRLKSGPDLELPTNYQTYDYVPCYRPLYANRYYPKQNNVIPSIKVFLIFEDVLKIASDGYVHEVNLFTSNSNTASSRGNKLTYYNNDFFTTPLHLHLLAEFLSPEHSFGEDVVLTMEDFAIRHYEKRIFSMEVTAYKLYQYFIDTKLDKICFTEKNKVDLAISDNITMKDTMRSIVLSKHKKLGAFAIFYPNVDAIFSEKELNEVRNTIDKLKLGTEKSGFIHSVAGDIPLFIHRLIAEYFAAEYIDDLLKCDITDERRESILGLNKLSEVYKILNKKRVEVGSESYSRVHYSMDGETLIVRSRNFTMREH